MLNDTLEIVSYLYYSISFAI